MISQLSVAAIPLASLARIAGCGGSSSSDTAAPPPTAVTGTISMSITDDPWHDMDSIVISVTGMDFGHSNGEIHSFDIPGGPMDVDMMQLQNGVNHALMSDIELPAGDYDWMRVRIDPDQSFMQDNGTGGHHGRPFPGRRQPPPLRSGGRRQLDVPLAGRCQRT